MKGCLRQKDSALAIEPRKFILRIPAVTLETENVRVDATPPRTLVGKLEAHPAMN